MLVFVIAVVAFIVVCMLVGWMFGLGTLVFGGARERRRQQEAGRQDFIDKFGMAPEAVLQMNATCAGMTVKQWRALPAEEQNLIILSWDLGGKRGGPHLAPELMALRNGH